MNPVSNDWVLPLLGFNYSRPILKQAATSEAFGFVLRSVQASSAIQCIALHLILVAFQKNFFFGTQAALEITGTHGRPNVKVESAPAAISSLSAACRCASHPPSNPSAVLPPEIGTQSAMAGFSRF